MTTKTKTNDSDMSAITAIEFERQTLPSETYLSELGDDGPPYTVHGVALGAGDVTKGASGIKKKWPADELKKASDSLKGKNLVVDHENSAHGVVGNVTKAGYREGTGIIYEAELHDEDLAERIKDGLLEVSIRGYHDDVDELEEDEETDAVIVQNIEFENLSIVPSGASPSNTLEMGEHAELSAAELSAFTDDLEEAELETIEPGMWVEWEGGDMHGVTISPIEDGEIEVDIYEEIDGKWRATGETTTVSVDSLDKWDVSEDDIGAQKDEEDSEEEDDPDEEDSDESEEENEAGGGEAVDPPEFSEGDMVKWQVNPSMMGKIVHAPKDDDIVMVEVMEMVDGNMESTGFTVTAGYSDIEKMKTDMSAEENATIPNGSPPSDDEKSNSSKSEATDGNSDVNVGDVVRLLNNFVAENATTTKDVPTEDAEPDHKPMGADDDPVSIEEITVRELLEGLRTDELNAQRRVEGEEIILDDDASRRQNREDSPERFVKGEEDEELTEDESADEGESNSSESSDVEELQSYDMHEVTWDGTTTSDWSEPALEDFLSEMDTDAESWDDLTDSQKESIASHYIISASGFPPEDFGDLKLPVVEPSGELNESALRTVKGGHGAPAVEGISDSMEEDIIEYVNGLAKREFDENWGSEGEENADAESTDGSYGVRVLPGDDLQQWFDKSGESDTDSLTQLTTTMNDDIEEKLAELEEPVAVEATELEELQDKANRFEEMSENLEALRERTDILDEVDRSQVEELSETDEPVIVESGRFEELQEEAEQVASLYAEQLAEEYDAFSAEELTDKFSIEELHGKFEEQIGKPSEELGSDPEPRSQDPSEEELEDDGPSGEEAELQEEAEEKREEIREKIISDL